jgi:flagellin
MTNEVTLSASLRSNLLTNQLTQRLIDQTTFRLATGKKVNSALDDVNAFFAAQSLSTRASDISRLLDGIGQGIQTLKAADAGLSAMTKIIEQMQAIAREAKEQAIASGGAPPNQATLEASFDGLRTQIDQLARDAGYRGINLLNGSTLTITFNETGSSTLSVPGVDFTVGGDLAVDPADFTDETAADTVIAQLDAALTLVRGRGGAISSSLTTIQARQNFTAELINILKEGSDKLTLADSNEEGAKLVALQTRQQLGTTALSLAAQSQQAVLRLFS